MQFRDLKESNKIIIMAALFSGACFLTYYYHAILDTDVIFTHLFYIPIVLASIWWKRRGIAVAVLLGLLLLVSHVLFTPDLPLVPDLCRAAMFVVIAFVVAFLSEQTASAGLLYKSLAGNSHTGVYILQDGKLQYVNQRAIEYTGFSEDELMQMSPLDWVHPDDKEEAQKNAIQMLKGIRKAPYEFRVFARDGKMKWILETVTPIQFRGRKAILGNAMDITDRKRAEEALRESEEKHRTILENIEDGYHEVNLAGSFTFFNESFRKMLGYPADELLGMNFKAYAADEENARKVFQAYNGVYRTGEPLQRFEWDVVRKDGARRSIEVSASLIKDSSGKPLGFRGIVRDVTERKAAEDAVNQQLRFLQILMDAIPNPVFYKDRKGRYQGCNKAFEEYLGLGKTEIVGKTVYEIAPVELAQTYHKMDLDLMGQSGTQVYESRVKYADGILHDVIFNKATYQRRDGSVAGLIGVILDITERKRAEEVLRESRQILQGVLNTIPVRVFWKDRNLQYLGCNKPFAQDAGFSEPDELLGKDDYAMGWRDQADLYRSDDRQVIETGTAKLLIEEPQTTPDGNTIWLLTSKTPLRDAAGEISGVLGTYMDITKRKQLEAQLSQAGKMESLGQLASGAAHEIRNPLNIMSLRLQMLDVTGKALDDNVRKAIDTCNNQIRRITGVLEGLQEFSRMPLVEKRLDDLNKIIGGVVDSFDAKFKNEGITAEIRGGDGIPSFMLDKEKIAMVIAHLISNAVDAMKDRETKRLGISTEKTSEDKSVRIIISDTGHGIKEENMARIFDPFFTTKDPDKGKGLGLAISYGIIRDHGGTIRAENNEQGGATFIVELPI